MSRSVTYLILATLALVGLSASAEMSRTPASGAALGSAFAMEAPDARASWGDPLPQERDSARVELERGRYWHASRILERRVQGADESDPEQTLLLARAHAGWRNWEGARDVLTGAEWLDEISGGEGWRILGRAREELGDAAGAAEAYSRYLERAPDLPDSVALPHRVRRARMLARAERWDEVLAAVEELEETGAEELAGWTALAAARFAASRGRPDEVQALLAGAGEERRRRATELRATALLAQGDTAAAEHAFLAALEDPALTGARRAEVWTLLGEIRMRPGEEAEEPAAREAFHTSLETRDSGGAAVRAARGLLELGEDDPAVLRTAAEALESGGATDDALRAWDRYVERVETPEPEARLARARLLARTSGRADEAVAELGALSAPGTAAEIGAPALEAWAALRARQGRSADRRTLLDRLIERHPSSAEAANAAFLRADALHDEGRRDEALEGYRATMEMNPGLDRAGLARMRVGQMHLHRGEPREAAEVFEEYVEHFPEGRRWQQATFWAAVAWAEAGEEERARELLQGLRERDPLDYYALLAVRELDQPFPPDLPEGPEPGPVPPWMERDLTLLDRLDASGLAEGADVVEERLRERAATPDERLLLAAALHERGRTIAGINLAWEVRREGREWDRRLLEVMYPLPYREQLRAEAAEWDLDPHLVAAIIRRESAWEEDISSRAGARGLMQVMPETGRALARRVGPDDFHPRTLGTAEVNLHLGSAFLGELLDRYDGTLPLVLSAYNAGPHRVEVWRTFPEREDLLRFGERIPFGETREYVRQVIRNREMYAWLHPELAEATDQ